MCVVITLSHTGLSGEVGFYTVSGRVCVCVRACVVDTRRKVCDMMRTNELRDSDEQEEVQPWLTDSTETAAAAGKVPVLFDFVRYFISNKVF